MKAFQLTAKKKIALKLLAVIAVVLVIYIINIQTNQPDNLPANYMECLKNPEITEIYIDAVTALASLSVWVAASKVKFWK